MVINHFATLAGKWAMPASTFPASADGAHGAGGGGVYTRLLDAIQPLHHLVHAGALVSVLGPAVADQAAHFFWPRVVQWRPEAVCHLRKCRRTSIT